MKPQEQACSMLEEKDYGVPITLKWQFKIRLLHYCYVPFSLKAIAFIQGGWLDVHVHLGKVHFHVAWATSSSLLL